MDRETLIFNITRLAAAKDESPSGACIASGLSKNFVSEVKRGRMPSVASVAALASHLGVTTSDLVGDAKPPEKAPDLLAAWAELNDEGRERLLTYAQDLVASGRYIKNHAPGMGAKEA